LLQDKFEHGKPLSDEEKAILERPGIAPELARDVDTFNLLTDNCATLSCSALRAGGADVTPVGDPLALRNQFNQQLPTFYLYGSVPISTDAQESAQHACEASGGKNPSACGAETGKG
jgi:hypothetical protein